MITHSVILPVYNERENLDPLIRELSAALTTRNAAFEIIAVDDSSTDGSWEKLRELAAVMPHLRIFRHRRNAGQSAALATGWRLARGGILITMDADGQNDPADLPELLDALTGDVEAVCGIRMGRQDSAIRKLSSRIANRFRNAITGDTIQDAGCTFRVIRATALAEMPVFNGTHRFLPTLLRYQGYVVKELPIRHRPRTWGASKYGIRNRFWRGLVDCFAMRWWKKRVIPGRRCADES
ncbi:MAG TPA: glycosyltransferase family 2 protein [Kiritimatiellia bacterium]|nr:glycosyltransferase family 2 protein [Kiritimatiellia bacterium]